MKNGVLHITLVCLFVTAISPAFADDLEIFGGGLVELKPNVLILFDNSGSMRDNGRITTAETVVTDLINDTDGVRFGLMTFNDSNEGGYIVEPCQDPTETSKATLTSAVAAIADDVQDYGSDWVNHRTPLAETLAEAGRYFAGLGSWYSSSVYASNSKYLNWYDNGKYVSPIEEACQQNNIIIMTDGESTHDLNTNLWAANFIGTKKIGDQDSDGDSSKSYSLDGSDYLDDVAKFLHENDLRPNWPSPSVPLYDQQSITTSTIGFQTNATANALLETTADSTHGRGIYNSAVTSSQLQETFQSIVKNVLETNSVFVSPVIPLDPTNQIDAGNKVYMSFFKPQSDGQWIGNLKAYQYVNGQILDVDGNAVFGADGYIDSGARSFWSASDDGPEVNQGGVGQLLVANDARNIYTYLGQDDDLTADSNEFTKDTTVNAYLTETALNVTVADRGATIDRTRDETGTWPLGTIVHSSPVVQTYNQDLNNNGENDSYIYVGANDGMLHVFNAETGQEEWGFVPPGQLPRLSLLSDGKHDYFVDGSPIVEAVDINGSMRKLLVFGERRGGTRYYALDITDPLSPVWVYQITDTLLNNAGGKLGLSWSKPQFKKIRSAGVTRDVFLLSGGYDAANQESDSPAASDSLGRAIYAVRADTGEVFGLNLNGEDWPAMTNSILDVTGFDLKGTGYLDRVYAGDLGGNLFAARYLQGSDLWEKFVLLDLPAPYVVGGNNITLGRKFMTKPEVTIEQDGECIYLGSGDREQLLATDATDAFYVVCNDWKIDDVTGQFVPVAGLIDPAEDLTIAPEDLPDYPFTEIQDKLVDLTSDKLQNGTLHERTVVQKSLDKGKGWFIRMENAGEKITSPVNVLDGKIYFTTFTPEGSSDNQNPCTNNYNLGKSRLYMLDYKTGMAAYDLNNDGYKTKEERSVELGTSVAYDPVLTTSGDTTYLLTGAGGKFFKQPVDTSKVIQKYFWRQIN